MNIKISALIGVLVGLSATASHACIVNDSELKKQDNWRWDSKSHNLIYDASGAVSPAGGTPNFRGSYNYVLYYVPKGCKYKGVGQDNWRWDSKSHNLIYDASGAVSPAGGTPDFRGSYNYVLFSTRNGLTKINAPLNEYQIGWKWDNKSQNLIYEDSDAISPVGGKPNFRGSYNYALEYK